jgi:23S rRNA pseudouridine2605 synthase
VKAPNYELEQRQQRPAGKTGAPGAFKRSDRPEHRGRSDAGQPAGDRDEKSTRTPSGDPNTTRLNRYIANSGVCSRREADELIARGDISVNGKVVTEMGFRVREGDMVKYGTKALTPERFVYVLLNKPKDYLTTTDDPEERKTVMELVADAGNFRMYPVGRLDRKTTGLLLLTNDGELADKLTHPSNEVRKIYQVELDKPITEEHFDTLKKGIELEDGPIKPDALSIVTPDAYVVGIEIHSGRNRIVRRMFESLGYEVTKLDRTTYAGLTKKDLPRGKWRFLDPKEVVKLKYLS